mgnify:CR=1 FL=1
MDRLVEFRRVFVPPTKKEAREARRRRRKIGWDSRDWVPGFAEAPALKTGEDGDDFLKVVTLRSGFATTERR